MTGAEFSEVDIDLLADYVGGALDGTPDEATVAALVADDPAWRAAYDDLTDGMASVSAGLRALITEPMPTDIAVRLTAALDDLPPLARPGTAEAAEVPAPVDGRSGGRRVTAVGESHPRRGSRRAGRSATDRGRGPRHWAPRIAVAAGVLALAGIGFGSLVHDSPDSASDVSTTAGGAPAAQENAPMLDPSNADAGSAERNAGALAAVLDIDRISASGVDYRPDSLANDLARALDEAFSTEKRSPDSTRTRVFDATSPPGLERLTQRTALADCLAAIARENGGGAIAVQSVDYARYLGDPALVVRFTAGNGRWAWASGPGCGTPGAAAATLQHVKVG